MKELTEMDKLEMLLKKAQAGVNAVYVCQNPDANFWQMPNVVQAAKMSPEIDKLAIALSKVQGEIKDANKDKQGYGYNYADLSQILEICRPMLSKNDLSVCQLCCSDGEKVGVETILMHSSGQYMSGKIMMNVHIGKGMTFAQAAGSTITYCRRYALAAMIGICQADNDAASDVDTVAPKVVEYKRKDNAAISPGGIDKLKFLVKTKNITSDEVDKWCKKAQVANIDSFSQEQCGKLIHMLEQRG